MFQIDADMAEVDKSVFSCDIYVTRGKATDAPLSSLNSVQFIFGKRPELKTEVLKISSGKMGALAYICGPGVMVDELEVVTQQAEIDFRHETFEL